MRRKLCIRLLALLLTITLVGCGSASETSIQTQTKGVDNTETDNNEEGVSQNESLENADEQAVESEGTNELSEEEKILAEQKNSFSMMYYLAITAEEIRTSKDNRLVLEDIYTSLLNDINPDAVDEITQEHLQSLRDIIKSYLNISVKRERLKFIYNQEKAAAIRSAVPNPLTVLTVSNAMDWKKLALTIGYTAVDSYNNYKQADENAELAYIMSGWELDDEEKDAVMKNRDRAFDYMVDMVQEYHLDGMKTLNEEAVEKFAAICATENPTERIKLLRAEEQKYSLLGNYWLELADAYFETSRYTECLECVEKYVDLATGIYREDFNYLQILPKAIVAAQEIYSGDQYIEYIARYTDAIIVNTSTEDWAARYFAAQSYLDLYAKTNDDIYLEKVYKIASENVTVLLKDQRKINDTYEADIVEQTAVEPDYRYMTKDEEKEAKKEYKEEKKHVKDYNKALKSGRKTELPSLYEPLVLNCELLFNLAGKMDIDSSEKSEMEAILETETNGIFITKPINDAYSFTGDSTKNTIEFKKNEIIIPVDLLTANSIITVAVSDNETTTIFDDCVVTKVDREGESVATFKAYVSSKKMEKYKWTADSKITVSITYTDAYEKTVDFNFAVSTFKEHWYGDKVEFEAL